MRGVIGECLAEIDFKNVNSLRKRAGREESGGKRIQRKGVEIFKQWKKEVTKTWRVSLGKRLEKRTGWRGERNNATARNFKYKEIPMY